MQGESARLFPVLSTTSREGRATSIFLACFSAVDEFGKELLNSIGKSIGKRTKFDAFTEIVFESGPENPSERPDGLLIVRTGPKEWKALVESKIGRNELSAEQIERYRIIAKDRAIDCVITVSNQFTPSPQHHHPVEAVRKSKSKIPVYHWSWMYVLTTVDLLLSNEEIQDVHQEHILKEFRRFLSHESTGVRGFEMMPTEWAELNRLISAGGKVLQKSDVAASVLSAWRQETRDLSLILSRYTETPVIEKLPHKHKKDMALRVKDQIKTLCEEKILRSTLSIPDAPAPLEIVADLPRRTIDVGMTLQAPQDKVSPKARTNWLLRQVKTDKLNDLYVRLNWSRTSQSTTVSYMELSQDSGLADSSASGKSLQSFHIFYAKRIGARFTQRSKFITELESIVPEFYREIGQYLSVWRPKPPRIRDVATWTINDHSQLAIGSPARALFDDFRNQVLTLDPCVTEEFLKAYVAYKAETNFVDVVPQKNRLRLYLNMNFHELHDPRNLARDVTRIGHTGSGDVEVGLHNQEELPYIMGLVRQAFEKHKGNTETDM